MKLILLYPIVFILAISTLLAKQLNPKLRRSPIGLATYKSNENYIKITYGRSSVKDELNPVFGTIIPLRKLWRTGNDDATELTIIKDVGLNDKLLKAGTYTLFTIPDTATWTLIVNSEVGQWGLFKYQKDNDIIREELPVYKAPKVFKEFTIFIEESKKGADIIMIWGRTAIRIPLTWK